MFITVKYGENSKLLANPECLNSVLLEHLREQCNHLLQDSEGVDLSDMNGKVKHLHRHPHDYGSDFLHDRETTILLKYTVSDSKPSYTPLLTGKGAIDSELWLRINTKSSGRLVTSAESEDGARAISRISRASKKSVTSRRSASRAGGTAPPPNRKT